MIEPPSPLPLGFRFLNVAGRSLGAAKLPIVRLDEENVIEAAMKETGLSDFGAPYYREGLLRLLESAKEDAALHFIGRLAFREATVNSLVNRLLLTEARNESLVALTSGIRISVAISIFPHFGPITCRAYALSPLSR